MTDLRPALIDSIAETKRRQALAEKACRYNELAAEARARGDYHAAATLAAQSRAALEEMARAYDQKGKR